MNTNTHLDAVTHLLTWLDTTGLWAEALTSEDDNAAWDAGRGLTDALEDAVGAVPDLTESEQERAVWATVAVLARHPLAPVGLVGNLTEYLANTGA